MIVILDGHHSHKTILVVEYVTTNGIEIETLPPYCTKTKCKRGSQFQMPWSVRTPDAWAVVYKGQRISYSDMAGIFATAYNKATTLEKAVNVFQVCQPVAI